VQVEALASSAVRAADKLHAALLIVFTSTGRTARIIAKCAFLHPACTECCVA
jgi:pyruvate kinase